MARLLSVALLAIFGLSAVSGQTLSCTVNGKSVGYDSSTYNCLTDSQGVSQICIKGQLNCRAACFNPNIYCCDSTGSLQQASDAKCASGSRSTTSSTRASTTSSTRASTTTSAIPTSSSTTSRTSSSSSSTRTSSTTSSTRTSSTVTPTSSGTPTTCNGQTFGSGYVCAISDQGTQKLCPAGAPNACGNACYLASVYCCETSSLKPIGTCKNNADNGGRPTTSTSTSQATSQTTGQTSATRAATTQQQTTQQTSRVTSTTTSASTIPSSTTNNGSNPDTGSGICGSTRYDPCSATCALINGQYQITGKLITFV